MEADRRSDSDHREPVGDNWELIMVNGQAGKGSRYRPYKREAWERGYLRVYGIRCPECGGMGRKNNSLKNNSLKNNSFVYEKNKIPSLNACTRCNGIGYIEKPI